MLCFGFTTPIGNRSIYLLFHPPVHPSLLPSLSTLYLPPSFLFPFIYLYINFKANHFFVCDLVLKPISAITKVKMNVKPGSDLSMPKVSSYNYTFCSSFLKIAIQCPNTCLWTFLYSRRTFSISLRRLNILTDAYIAIGHNMYLTFFF